VDEGALAGQVELDVAEFEPRAGRARRTPAYGPDARREFLGIERLDQVVVGTAVETAHAIAQQVACGHD
jgi:hypothetical protein